MHSDDMRERGVSKFDLVDITSIDMPETIVSCAVGDCGPQSDQPLMKHFKVTVERASTAAEVAADEA